MARAVDRLLAQLPGLQVGSDPTPAASRRFVAQVGTASNDRGFQPATPGDLIGLWARVMLGLILAVMMPTWPYVRDCGMPLFAYLGAVAAVILAGAWAAITAWKLRTGLAHTLSLILMFWGIVLVAEQMLPRIGYSVDRATWQCEDAGAGDPPM